MGSRAHTPETRPLHVYRLVYGPDWVIAHDEDDGWFRKGRTPGSSQAADLRKFLRETDAARAAA